MAKIKKVELVVDEIVAEKETIVAEEETVVEEPQGSFADTIDLTPKVAYTVTMAIQQAADRLARDKANFPQI